MEGRREGKGGGVEIRGRRVKKQVKATMVRFIWGGCRCSRPRFTNVTCVRQRTKDPRTLRHTEVRAACCQPIRPRGGSVSFLGECFWFF